MSNLITILGVLIFCLASLWLLKKNAPDQPQTRDDSKAATQAIAGSVILLILAYALGFYSGTPPHKSFALTQRSILQGLITLVPMLVMLFFIERGKHPKILKFKDQQTKLFSEIGFHFTPSRILIMSLGAGIGEELLFRGAMQGTLYHYLPIALAIVLPSIIFGALHFHNFIYVILATVIGVYLGISFVITENIAVPIIAHAVYDIFALHRVAVMISQRNPQNDQSE